MHSSTRRFFLQTTASSFACLSLAQPLWGALGADAARHIATNTYPWSTFARRSGKELPLHTDALLSQIAACGIVGYEPIINRPSEFDGLSARLAKHKLEMRSLYVNSTLHEAEQVDQSARGVIDIAKRARDLGTRIIVTNPSPIRWGGDEDKSDDQLKTQAEALDNLGASLRELGLMLAYHNHDAELRQGAREFHHMLTGTSADNVKFCLDSHWVYRGCGNSEVALFDAVEHYHERIVELHLRQSTGGIWQEVFTMQGDIDYTRLFSTLAVKQIQPHLVLEQAVEKGSPAHLSAPQAHEQGYENLHTALANRVQS